MPVFGGGQAIRAVRVFGEHAARDVQRDYEVHPRTVHQHFEMTILRPGQRHEQRRDRDAKQAAL